MATLNQIKVNTGTEDNPNYVLHDVHDKRLDDGASSLVTTCTHLLATNAALSSFNPITSDNLVSVLGDTQSSLSSTADLNTITIIGRYRAYGFTHISNIPAQMTNISGILVVEKGVDMGWRVQKIFLINGEIWVRNLNISDPELNWYRDDNYGTTSLSNLASVLGVKDIGDGLYLISNTLVIGTYIGQYAHTDKINTATQITDVIASKLDYAVTFIILYHYYGDILLRGTVDSTTYAFVEGRDMWGANWAIWKNSNQDWTDF